MVAQPESWAAEEPPESSALLQGPGPTLPDYRRCEPIESLGLACLVLAAPKPDEWCPEDRHALLAEQGPDPALRVALSDGCSESLFGGDWAEVLVSTLCDGSCPPCLQEHELLELLAKARTAHAPRPQNRREQRRLQEGDYATLLVGSVKGTAQGLDVQAMSIGDSVVFAIEPSAQVHSFPARQIKDLWGPPPLIWSRAGQEDKELQALSCVHWQGLDPSSLVAFCTDEMARWWMLSLEGGLHTGFLDALEQCVVGQSAIADIRFAVPGKTPALTDDRTLILCSRLSSPSPLANKSAARTGAKPVDGQSLVMESLCRCLGTLRRTLTGNRVVSGGGSGRLGS